MSFKKGPLHKPEILENTPSLKKMKAVTSQKYLFLTTATMFSHKDSRYSLHV